MTDEEREVIVNCVNEAQWLTTVALREAKNENDRAFIEYISKAQKRLIDATRLYFMPWRTIEFVRRWKDNGE